jgi:hypothetical protein
MRLPAAPVIAGLAFVASILVGGDAARAATTQALYGARPATVPSALTLAVSEVRVEQAKGRLPHGKLPEIGKDKKNGDSAAGNHRPQTCDSSNAMSQSCATATQQARPIAK